MSLRDKVDSGATTKGASPETFINTDLTADYEAGRQFVDARVKAFGAGVSDRMAEVQQAMKHFSGGKFVIAEATYKRPSLPPSDEQATDSFIKLLYGDCEVVNE
jgi:hypothetical protein